MSLSAHDRQALGSIEDELTESDPNLAAMLTTFTRLAGDEEMPPRETVRQREPPAPGPSHDSHLSRELAKGLLLWLVVALAVVAASGIGLAVSHGASRVCTNSFTLACTERANTHPAHPAAHQPPPGQPAASHGGIHG